MPPDHVPRLQPPSRSSGPPGSFKPSVLPSQRPPYPASGAQPASTGPALSLPAAPDRPPPGLSSPAAPPGTEPGVRAAASRGQGRSRSARAPPAGPSPLRHPPGPGSPLWGRPVLTGRRSPPGRQQERRRGIQRPRPGPGWSAAPRSAAPPPAPARAQRIEGRPLLATGGIDACRLDARARRQTRARREPGAAQTVSAMDAEAPAAVSGRPCLEALSALAFGDCGACLKGAELHCPGKTPEGRTKCLEFDPRHWTFTGLVRVELLRDVIESGGCRCPEWLCSGTHSHCWMVPTG